MQLIFGPVNSRRFGTSLGIDLSPQTKQCNFDCLYCELAPAAPIKEQHYTVTVEEIIKELQKHLSSEIDVITLTANGEPTLYPQLDKLVDALDHIKNTTKTLILSNAATLDDSTIFKTLLKLDKVKLSLDAASQEVFKKIDRPVEGLSIEQIKKNIITFSKAYGGELYIEILFVKGLNDTDAEIAKLNATLLEIANIARIDIGTIDRPPAYPVEPLGFDTLYSISKKFDPSLPVYIASRKQTTSHKESYSTEEILNTLDKRPLTKEDMEILFDDDSMQRFETLLKEGKITTKKVGEMAFYIPSENFKRKRVKNS